LWGSTCISHGAPRRWRCLRTVVGPLAHFAVTHKYPRGIFQKHPSPHITTQQQTENWGIKNIIKSGGNLLQETLIIPKKNGLKTRGENQLWLAIFCIAFYRCHTNESIPWCKNWGERVEFLH